MSDRAGIPASSSSNNAESRPGLPNSRYQSNGSTNTEELSPKRAVSSQHIRISKHLDRPHLTGQNRTLSDVLRSHRNHQEQETLLGDDELADRDGCVRGEDAAPGPRQNFFTDPNTKLNVYYNIQRIRRLVLASIEDPYSIDQLKEPRMNVLIVKPLVDRLFDADDISIGEYALPGTSELD
jgi:hypothetical protein